MSQSICCKYLHSTITIWCRRTDRSSTEIFAETGGYSCSWNNDQHRCCYQSRSINRLKDSYIVFFWSVMSSMLVPKVPLFRFFLGGQFQSTRDYASLLPDLQSLTFPYTRKTSGSSSNVFMGKPLSDLMYALLIYIYRCVGCATRW